MGSVFAQQDAQSTWPKGDIDRVVVHLPFASSVKVQPSNEPTILLRYRTEGEYQNTLLLVRKLKERTLYLKENRSPDFTAHQDKLSAHKVIASSFLLSVPEDVVLEFNITQADVRIESPLQHLDLFLGEGSVTIASPKVFGLVRTLKGTIFAPQEKNPSVVLPWSASKNIPKPLDEQNLILQSREGKIFVQSTGNVDL